jgi:hypothetical protein
MYLALGIVIVVYVLVSALIVMTLTLPAMEANGGYVLSEAGQHILGRVGFVIAVAPVAYSSPLPSPPHSCCSSRLPRSGRWPALRVPHRLRHGQPQSPRVYRETGAKPWLLMLAVALSLALFALLLGYTIHIDPRARGSLLAVLALSFVFEVGYRRPTGLSLALESTTTAAAS